QGRRRARARRVELLLRDVILLDQVGISPDLVFGVLGDGAVALELSARLGERGLIGARIDLKEQVSLPDVLTFPESHLRDFPRHACLDRDRRVRLDVPDRADLNRDVLPGGRSHRDRNRLSDQAGSGLFRAPRPGQGRREKRGGSDAKRRGYRSLAHGLPVFPCMTEGAAALPPGGSPSIPGGAWCWPIRVGGVA